MFNTDTDILAGKKFKGLKTGKVPLLVIGADGLDLEVIKSLIARNKLPNIKFLMETGAWGKIISEREMRSPALWTTIATGRPRSVHNIYDFVTDSRLWPKHKQSKERRLVTSDMRKVPAVWNLAKDKKVAIIGWITTWPAEEVNGIMVSPYVPIGSHRQVTIKGTVYPDIPNQVFPEDRWEEIQPLIVTLDKVPDELVHSFAEEPDSAMLKDFPVLSKYMRGLRWSLAHTMTMRNIAFHLLHTDTPDLTMVYFEGSDSLGHRFWLFRQSIREIKDQLRRAGYPTAQAGRLKKAFGQIMDRYYTKLDTIIGELIKASGEQGYLVLLSDHGFKNLSKDHRVLNSVPFTGEHRIEGTLCIHGPQITPGKEIVAATLYNIAPTVLELIGIAPPASFEGNSLLHQIRLQETEQVSMEEAESADEEGIEIPFSAEELDRLRSLGYVN